jgi:hypothetical protein
MGNPPGYITPKKFAKRLAVLEKKNAEEAAATSNKEYREDDECSDDDIELTPLALPPPSTAQRKKRGSTAAAAAEAVPVAAAASAPKPKKQLTEAQIANLAAGREKRLAAARARQEELKKLDGEIKSKREQKFQKQVNKKIKEIAEHDTSEDEAPVIIKKAAKKPKKKIVYVSGSDDSDSEVEIRKKPSKKQPVNITINNEPAAPARRPMSAAAVPQRPMPVFL